ncbi:MAG: phosphoglucosamine mutase [Terriglobia bacterium]
MGKLFGTDGIRGVAGEPPLDAGTIFAVGRAVGEFLRGPFDSSRAAGLAQGNKTLRVLLGEDTRESSPWVTRYLAAGLRAGGVEAVSAGVVPTPGVAQLVRAQGFAAGVMVSASHNPYRDNGLKLIAATGMKFADETEEQIEKRIQELLAGQASAFAKAAADWPRVDAGLVDDYVELLRQATLSQLAGGLSKLHLVVDCANGTAASVAPKLFERLGAKVTVIHAAPDGKNINQGCGTLHPEELARTVKEAGADLGVAFDGDADRAIFASGTGRVVNGDGVLLAAARWMKEKKTLKGGVVVGTVMANLGLEVVLKREGLTLVRTKVGDRYVLEEMQRRRANLGGEQSGHIIFLDDAPTGDGLLTALKILTIVCERGASLDKLTADLKVFPQVLRNIRVRERVPLEKLPAVQKAIEEATAALAPPSSGQGPRGRVVVRYSGTEPLLRVMVEAETEEEVERWTEHISGVIERMLGG